MENDKIKMVMDAIKLPLKYDNGQMIYDADNNLLLDVCGWGRFQYKKQGDVIQDAFGQMVVDAFNMRYGSKLIYQGQLTFENKTYCRWTEENSPVVVHWRDINNEPVHPTLAVHLERTYFTPKKV